MPMDSDIDPSVFAADRLTQNPRFKEVASFGRPENISIFGKTLREADYEGKEG